MSLNVVTHVPQPEILCEQPVGALLCSHVPDLVEVVLMAACLPRVDAPRGRPDAGYLVTVIACRVAEGERGYIKPGTVLSIRGATPVQRLQHWGSLALYPVDMIPEAITNAMCRAL